MKIDELKLLSSDDKIVNLYGWVDNIRDHGGLTFVDLRDFTNLIQLVIDKDLDFNENLKNEYYISVDGVLTQRKDELVNTKLDLGKFEIIVTNISIINKSKSLPFQIEDGIETDENIRLKYRYLDLRRNEMKLNILARSKTFKSIRKIMDNMNIFEIDTPTLTKSTPEGAKDFLVPSRKSPGKFYALPQSPQMYKQLFMISGFPNYYQIAKCYRDEDSRKDRQPEFTQLDLEFSNANPEIVKMNVEQIIKFIFDDAFDLKINIPFSSFSYKDVMELYGTDKPDLRIKEKIFDISNYFTNTSINFLRDILKNDGCVKALHSKNILTRKEIDEIDALLKENGSNGLGWFKIDNDSLTGPLAKFLSPDETESLLSLGNGTLLFQAGFFNHVCLQMDVLRRKLFKPVLEETFNFIWIDSFPFFEKENDVFQPSHHPFTAPKDNEIFKNDPENAEALHYDLVLNGVELGSGSQRINDPSIQKLVLEKWGLSESEIKERFGWFIEALSYGTPQHAGFAIGVDRLITVILNQPSIRDVIPFPKTQSGMDPLTDAPSSMEETLLSEYNLKYIEKNE